jgi:hypothetical protein
MVMSRHAYVTPYHRQQRGGRRAASRARAMRTRRRPWHGGFASPNASRPPHDAARGADRAGAAPAAIVGNRRAAGRALWHAGWENASSRPLLTHSHIAPIRDLMSSWSEGRPPDATAVRSARGPARRPHWKLGHGSSTVTGQKETRAGSAATPCRGFARSRPSGPSRLVRAPATVSAALLGDVPRQARRRFVQVPVAVFPTRPCSTVTGSAVRRS